MHEALVVASLAAVINLFLWWIIGLFTSISWDIAFAATLGVFLGNFFMRLILFR